MATITINGVVYTPGVPNIATSIPVVLESQQLTQANTVLSRYVSMTERRFLPRETTYKAGNNEIYHDTEGTCSLFFYVTGGDNRTFTGLTVIAIAKHMDHCYEINWCDKRLLQQVEGSPHFPYNASSIPEGSVYR